jgi:hypothetical protein
MFDAETVRRREQSKKPFPETAAEQVIRADCTPACLSSLLCGFFQVVACGRAAAQFQRSAAFAP